MADTQTNDKKPQSDPAEKDAFFPSPYSLGQFTSPKSDLSGADYAAPYQGSKKILMIGADERYLLTDNGIRRCPVTRHILEAREPFFWTKTVGKDGDLYRVVRVPLGQGTHGLQIPIFGPLGLEGAMSLGGERIDASPQARLALGLIAEAAFLAARRVFEAPIDSVSKLSDREREVLAWTAAGRPQADIAVTLGLSERTVENHLRRIRKRLGVLTTAQAIRVAIRNGEIDA